jgi:hypothetical protein
MNRALPQAVVASIALAAMLAAAARGQIFDAQPSAPANPYASLVPASPYPETDAEPIVTDWTDRGVRPASAAIRVNPDALPTSASWIVPASEYPSYVDAEVYCEGDPWPQQSLVAPADCGPWYWQVLPDGLIYRSYWAGPREPRLGVTMFRNQIDDSFWDPIVGARVALVRFGDGDPIHPHGWELDAEGAAMARLTLDDVRDLESVDFRGGTFLAYGVSNWQFKFGYYHVSSHLGDEFALANPGSLADRANYVRDSLVAGASFYPIPELRLYSEAGYGLNVDGGAEPWEFQFGTELSKAGPTGIAGSPFLALNVHLREEVDFGGDFTAQAGWLWRGTSGQTLRFGAHYLNGKSSQYQNFDKFEEQIGAGLWYDF